MGFGFRDLGIRVFDGVWFGFLDQGFRDSGFWAKGVGLSV